METWLWAGVLSVLLMGSSDAETLLYDPEPPADSAYVRVIAVAAGEALTVQVDGKVRGARLMPDVAGDYMVIAAGKHVITLSASGHREAQYSTTLDVSAGHAVTLAFTPEDAKPVLFEDHANANKLKAVLAVYQLNTQFGSLDIRSADGKVSVFSGLAPHTMRTLTVNPVKITLAAFREARSLASMPLDMAAGGTYSILLLPAPHDGLRVQVVQNKVERYTGK